MVPLVGERQFGLVFEHNVSERQRRDDSTAHEGDIRNTDVLFIATFAATTQKAGIGRQKTSRLAPAEPQ